MLFLVVLVRVLVVFACGIGDGAVSAGVCSMVVVVVVVVVG